MPKCTVSEKMEAMLKSLCDDPSNCRERLLHTAGILFADHGVDAVSTRALTKAARANLSAIAYYFGGKENLYNETLNYTIEGAQKLLGGAEGQLRADVAEAKGDKALLGEAAARFVRDLILALLSPGKATWQKKLVMREIDQPSEAFDRLNEAIFKPLKDAFLDLVVAATGRDRAAPETVILVSALLGECLIFHRNEPIVLRSLGWDSYTPERIEAVTAIVSDGILDALDLPKIAAEAPAPA